MSCLSEASVGDGRDPGLGGRHRETSNSTALSPAMTFEGLLLRGAVPRLSSGLTQKLVMTSVPTRDWSPGLLDVRGRQERLWKPSWPSNLRTGGAQAGLPPECLGQSLSVRRSCSPSPDELLSQDHMSHPHQSRLYR